MTTQEYRIIPSTAHASMTTFRWTSQDDYAGAGNSFADADEASQAADDMDRTNPIEGGEWLIAASASGLGHGMFTVL